MACFLFLSFEIAAFGHVRLGKISAKTVTSNYTRVKYYRRINAKRVLGYNLNAYTTVHVINPRFNILFFVANKISPSPHLRAG